jgi:hypothetical protein
MFQSLPIPRLLDEWLEWCSNPNGDSIGYSEFSWIVENEPEKGWLAILSALQDPRQELGLGNLAAGPLEDLLSFHGNDFIERVETEAKTNPKFAWLLGGVWQHAIDDEIWARIQSVGDFDSWK